MTDRSEWKENRKLWAKTLRAEAHRQGRHHLNCDGVMCCLGILCELAGITPLEVPFTDSDRPRFQYDGDTTLAPARARAFVGLQSTHGRFYRRDMPDVVATLCAAESIEPSLTNCNDYGLTFHQIADIIEAEPDGLFHTC